MSTRKWIFEWVCVMTAQLKKKNLEKLKFCIIFRSRLVPSGFLVNFFEFIIKCYVYLKPFFWRGGAYFSSLH